MLLLMRMRMMRTLMITIIVWKTMVKSTTWWWSRSSRIFRRFVWLKTGALPKSQWGVAFCLKTVLSTRTSISCVFVFHHVMSEEKMICAGMNLCSYLVSDPSRWSFSFLLGPLHWSSSWQWQPCIAGCRFFQTLLWTELADFAQFFCKMYLSYMWPSRKTCLVWFGWVLPP